MSGMTADLTYFAPSVCKLLGCPAPELAKSGVPGQIADAAMQATGDGTVQRMLVYAPDAIGRLLLESRPEEYALVRATAPVELQLRSVLPPKTPVCFASITTGMPPEGHGIRKYERPPIEADTLFDALARAGKRVALVAVRDSSLDVMYGGRDIDYFSEDYDDQVTARVLQLIAAGAHDFIMAYHQEYDDLLHQTTPASRECIGALKRHCASFAQLAAAVHEHWRAHSRAIAFTPDHGAHIDPDTGRGDHGLDIPEDMDLLHFWGVSATHSTGSGAAG